MGNDPDCLSVVELKCLMEPAPFQPDPFRPPLRLRATVLVPLHEDEGKGAHGQEWRGVTAKQIVIAGQAGCCGGLCRRPTDPAKTAVSSKSPGFQKNN